MPNNPITDAALAELDRLHEAATPGEWRPDIPAWNKHRRNCKTAISSPTGTVLNTVTPKVPRDGVIGYRPPGECKIAQYIAALHNAYPALRQRLLDAEARLAEAERERVHHQRLREDSMDECHALKAELHAALYCLELNGIAEDAVKSKLAARDAQQRREGEVEAFNEMRRQAEEVGQQSGLAKKMCKIFADECIEQAAHRLREGK